MNAPKNSPLIDINIDNVLKFMIELSRRNLHRNTVSKRKAISVNGGSNIWLHSNRSVFLKFKHTVARLALINGKFLFVLGP